jgi:MFS family permease
MMWTICLYSLGTALTAFANGPGTLLLFRFLTGLGVGGEWAVGHALLAESVPLRMRGRAAALLQAGEPVGVGLAAVVGLLVTPLLGWRAVFLLSSLSAVIALLVRKQLPESSLWEKHEEKLSPAAALGLLGRYHLWGAMLKAWVLGVLKLGTYWTCYIWLPKFLQDQLMELILEELGQPDIAGPVSAQLEDTENPRLEHRTPQVISAQQSEGSAWRELLLMFLPQTRFGELLAHQQRDDRRQ